MIERFSAWPGTMLLRSWSGTPRLEQWVVDDTAIPKKGKHSVGVTRQYCSVLGKQEGLPPAPVVADAGYGDVTGFRESSSPRFDGGSSGIIRSSRMSWDSITTRDGDGGGSTITASCAWPPTVSWRPNAAAFSPSGCCLPQARCANPEISSRWAPPALMMSHAQLKVVAPGYLLVSSPSSFRQPARGHRGEL